MRSTDSILEGNYISESMMWKQSYPYSASYRSSYNNKEYQYYFGINFQTKLITQEVSRIMIIRKIKFCLYM